MKVTVGSHPDLPFPYSNGPEDPPGPIRGRSEPLRLATERHEQGVATLAAMMNHWLGRSGLSHDQLVAIAAWAMGEPSPIDAAVISRVRNGRQARGASWKHLDALASANRAIWLWQTKGQGEAWAVFGPHSGWGIRDQWLDDATWLPHPDRPAEPLAFSDMADVVAGYLELPYLGTTQLSPADHRKMNEALAHLLEQVIADNGWGPREGIRRLVEAYPVADAARQRRLRALITGDLQLTRQELEAELHALAEMMRVVRELKEGSYGPAELQRELLSGRRLPFG